MIRHLHVQGNNLSFHFDNCTLGIFLYLFLKLNFTIQADWQWRITVSMGNSRFRLSHVMPNVWFYKLRDFSRFRDSQRRRLLHRSYSTRYESAISLQRSSHSFRRTERVDEFPVNHIASREQAKEKSQMVDSELKRNTRKEKRSERGSYCIAIDSRISVGCSCRPTMDTDGASSSGGESVSRHDEQSVLAHKKNNCTTQFMERIDRTKLGPQLDTKSGNAQHVNVAGLPSPVDEDEGSVKFHDSDDRFKVCDSFAVVKSSGDPQKDFRDSMVQMITESNIHCYADLQQLLQCYLSLNSAQNHNNIVKAFEHVTSDFTEM